MGLDHVGNNGAALGPMAWQHKVLHAGRSLHSATGKEASAWVDVRRGTPALFRMNTLFFLQAVLLCTTEHGVYMCVQLCLYLEERGK